MPQDPIKPISYLKLSTGLITEGAVSESQMPLDAVTESLNMKFNKIGSARLRDGTTLLGTALSTAFSVSPSVSPSASISPTQSASISPSKSPSVSPSVSSSFSHSTSPSVSPSSSISPSASVSPSVSPSLSPSASISPSISPSPSAAAEPAGNVLGLYEFRDSGNGTYNRLVAVYGTSLYYLSGSSWIAKRTGLRQYKARFTTFLDYLWMVNGSDSTAIWDGNPANSFITTGNAASAPIGKFIERFRNRVWIAGNSTYPDRLYYSSLPDVNLALTWDGDYVDISPADGENITAIIRTRSALLVFKNNHIYRVYSVTETEADPKINCGTYSADSVIEAKDGVYFHHPTGFYKYVNGEPEEISKPIIDIVKNITLANYGKVCGWLELNGDNIVWAVGDVTIDGVAFNNLEVRYTISTQTWTHYTKPTQALVASRYNDGSTVYQLVGDESGQILKMDTGLTDNSMPISYSLVHRWYNVDGLNSTRKDLTKFLFAHNKGAGTNVAWQNEDSVLNDWKPLTQLKDKNTGVNYASVRGRKCRFKLSGSSSGEPWEYDGFEVLEGTSEVIIP